MPSLKIVLDTNAVLRSISRRSAFTLILDKLYENAYELYISNDIQLEYEEKITDIFSKETTELIIGALSLLPNVKKIDVHFHLDLISTDPDDNKFADLTIAGNADYLVTNDKHFNPLKTIDFPKINIVTIDEFKKIILS